MLDINHFICVETGYLREKKLTMNELQNHMAYVIAFNIAPLRRTFNSSSRMPSILLMKKYSQA